MTTKTIAFYNKNAKKFEEQYYSTTTEKVHSLWVNHLLPKQGKLLDVGAGVGRDAKFFAEKGLEVTAVEPASELLNLGKKHTKGLSVEWINDQLPELKTTKSLNRKFDLILLSAVWMHIPLSQREYSFKTLVSLLASNGQIVISLRHGSNFDEREMFSVSIEEISEIAKKYGVKICLEDKNDDTLNREAVHWETVILNFNS